VIGVIVPVHDEEATLDACLASLLVAGSVPALNGECIEVVAVIDDCADRSAAIAAAAGVTSLEIAARNVGAARAIGASHVIGRGARWLAFTDADTCVAQDWLADQLALGVDAVCGSVGVDWQRGDHRLRRAFERGYTDVDGHRHIHGANLGVTSAAYAAAGGFLALPAHEDVALVRALERIGARIAWSARPRVSTSARRRSRTPAGFGATLGMLASALAVA
jgi:glycosyltransferase involved in cell wall biosynthesis